MSTHVIKSLPKAILLVIGIALMLPVATSWQSMFGSVHKAIGNPVIEKSSVVEKERMEGEMELMRQQIDKLTEKLEKESE